MRRHTLHATAALLTCTIGVLTAGTHENLASALPAALAVFGLFFLVRKFRVPYFDAHRLKVAVLTLILWVPLLVIFSSAAESLNGLGSCEPDFAQAEAVKTNTAEGEARVGDAAEEPGRVYLTGITAYSCGGAYDYDTAAGSIWAGVVDRKAIRKPAPLSRAHVKAARVGGTVAVSVLIDESGKVARAQAISGHPLLSQSALEAACRARFAPTLFNGPPVRVSGVLTYTF